MYEKTYIKFTIYNSTLIQTCRNTGKTFEISDEDKKFYESLDVPPPTLCPEERRRLRLSFRNERFLYYNTCSLCGNRIVSMYDTNFPAPVYCAHCWWSDKWDCTEYGQNFDFNRPFFEQFQEVLAKVPHLNLITSPDALENNCMYMNLAGSSKNCYMTFDSDLNEDSYYSNVLKDSQNCMDCSYTQKSQHCYECIHISNCYRLHFSQDCQNCSESYFLNNCKRCKNCLFCCNLYQKQYCIQNKQYTKEEYEKKYKQFFTGSYQKLEKAKKMFEKYVQTFPKKALQNTNTEHCSGDYILNSQNCIQSYNMSQTQDCKYCDSLFEAKDCFDVSSFGVHGEKMYESASVGLNAYNILFSFASAIQVSNLTYTIGCRQSSDSFGCANLLRKKYCILNKQYSKDKYEKLFPQIIVHMKSTGEWGNFFPPHISEFAYNETDAQLYFPLTKNEAIKQGYKWKDDLEKVQPPMSSFYPIPDNIADIHSDICKTQLTCMQSGKPYKIIPQELEFYRDHKLPIPHLHHDQRHTLRMSKRNPQILYKKKCNKCEKIIQTTYSPDRPEKVYCEECYLKEMY